MNVNVRFLKHFRLNSQLFGMRTNHRISGFDRFFHHVAQLAGLFDDPLARHVHRFDKQNIAAHFGPCQTGGNADMVFFLRLAETEFANAEIFFQIAAVNIDPLAVLVHQQPLDCLAGNVGKLALQVPHAGFPRIITDNVANGIVGNEKFLRFDRVFGKNLRHQVTLGNLDLLVFGITGKTNDFHTIKKRPRHVQTVGGGNKHYVRQIIVHFQIMIVKTVVLLRIQHFQKRRRRISAPVAAEFVYLVQQKQRIGGSGFFHALNDFARHRTDIGAPVSADLRFVAHTAERSAHKTAAGRPRNRLAERGFAHARRSEQT